MMDETEVSLDQRRKELQDRLAAQRGLVAFRVLDAETSSHAANGTATEVADGSLPALGLRVSSVYPRSMTMRLAKAHPALAIGAFVLGLTLVVRGRGDQLDGILSMAKAVEPLFDDDDTAD